MNFEQAYENYKNGTATDEEKAYVEGEIDKARKLTELIDSQDAVKCNIEQPDEKVVAEARKKYTIKSTLLTAAVSLAAFIVVAGTICAGVFGSAASYAKKNTRYSMTEAEAIAKSYVVTSFQATDKNFVVTEREKDFKLESNLKGSYYYYGFELQNGSGTEIDVYVNSHTGTVSLIDPER